MGTLTPREDRAVIDNGRTPGPWELSLAHDRAYGIHARGANGLRANVVNWGGLSRAASDEGQANARLIAAAPDLLEACKQAREWLAGWASAEPYIDALEAAIAKAERS